MNPQEKFQLEQFLEQLNSTQAGPKDSDANAMIADSAKRQPDAAYLLVQRAMGLEMALQVAQKQMTEMQTKIDQSKKPSGFLSGMNSWGSAAKRLGLRHVGRHCHYRRWCCSRLDAVPRYSEHDGAKHQPREWYSARPLQRSRRLGPAGGSELR